MHYVTKTYGHELGLSAAFRQHRATSHCRFIHGYPLSFKYTLGALTLCPNNWVMDFGGFKQVKQHLVDTYDHKMLIAEDDPHLDELAALAGLGLCDPIIVPFVGCEGFAQQEFDWFNHWLEYNHLDDIADRGLRLLSVEVREHAGNSAIVGELI